MFSNSTKYAIKSVLYLALNSNDKKRVVIKEISESINVPQAYIAKILQELSKLKVISSVRGPKGGFYLSEENRNQPCINVLIALNGVDRLTSCLLSLEKCDENCPCPLHEIANPLRHELFQNFSQNSIADLANKIRLGKASLPL